MRDINVKGKKPETVLVLQASLKPLIGTLLWVGLSIGNSAWALNPGDILTINSGACGNQSGGFATTNAHPPTAGQGSCFGMEVAPGFITLTRIEGNDGIIIGSTQSASGSHTGSPNGSENPGIDRGWGFFSNTGLDFTTAPIIEITPNSVLDFRGWSVTWNGIPVIDMGKNAHSGFTTGQAQISCTPSNCSNGATYTLAYTATVPVGDPSNFGGVKYSLRLEGTVIVPSGPQSLPIGIAPGNGIMGATTIRVDGAALTTAGIPMDDSFSNSGGYYDFTTPAPGGTTQVVLPLTTPLPSGFVYRKYKAAGGWSTFVEGGGNVISSAPGAAGGSCPTPNDPAYVSPATAGHYCLQLAITDGGPNDADGAVNGSVSDPGGVATPRGVPPGTAASGSSGCSLSATPVNPLERGDWWLLLGFVAWLGLVTRRKYALMK